MNKEIASANKIISFGQFKRNFMLHQDRLKHAKPTLTTRNQTKIGLGHRTARQPFGNTFNRTIDIQFENKALLKKLTDKNKQPKNKINLFQEGSTAKLSKNNRKHYYEQYERRLQNQGLLRRLKDTKTQYKMQTYVSERKANEKYINSISKFGLKGYKPNKTIVKFQVMEPDKEKYMENKLSRLRNKENVQFSRAAKIKTSDDTVTRSPRFLQKIKSHDGKTNLQPMINDDSRIRASNTSRHGNSDRSFSNSQSGLILSDPILNIIEQRKVKIGQSVFTIQGKQKASSVCLQITSSRSSHKLKDSVFKHQVQISRQIYVKRFKGNIDFLIKNIKFSKENDSFYIQ